MSKKSKRIVTSGKRKTSIARATLKQGEGVIRINGYKLSVYSNEIARLKIKEPLILAGDVSEEINASINVEGGGWQSQAEAARLALARGIIEFTNKEEIKEKFLEYDRHLLVADTRRKEANKPYRSSARAKRQKSKR